MLFVQFDAAASAATSKMPPPGTAAVLRVRRLKDAFDGLELRKSEPSIGIMRRAVLFMLGSDTLDPETWTARGLDVERGFAVSLGARDQHGSWPFGIAGYGEEKDLSAWLAAKKVQASSSEDGLVLAGPSLFANAAAETARSAWTGTLASDQPYAELVANFGIPRRLGGMWAAATRRGDRFQIEAVMQLPGLPPLHMLARDPPTRPEDMSPAGPGLVQIGARPAPKPEGPPSWDEPGPCCEMPADACVMLKFNLSSNNTNFSELDGADIMRQLSASVIDLHPVKKSKVPGIVAGDRVLIARSTESLAALESDDLVLDAGGIVRTVAAGDRTHVLGAVLQALPWPSAGQVARAVFRRVFYGPW